MANGLEWSQLAISVDFHADTLPLDWFPPTDGRRMRGCVHMFAFRMLDASIGGPSRSGTNDESLRERADVGELCHDSGQGTPLMVQYGNGLAAPLAWIDVAGHCSGRFAEGTLRNAQTKQRLTVLAGKFGQSAPEVTPARLDGITSATIDRSALDAMAIAEDRAGFALEVLAARGVTAGATLTLSDMHKTAGQQLVSLANKRFSDSGSTADAGDSQDPRQKVYAIDQLLADPTTIEDKASGQTVPTASAIEMDCARAEIKAVADSTSQSDSDTLLVLAALAAKHAYTAFQLGYPSGDSALFA